MEGSSSLPVTAVSQAETRTRLLVSAVFTLTLSILGRYLTYMPKPANVLPCIVASAGRMGRYHICITDPLPWNLTYQTLQAAAASIYMQTKCKAGHVLQDLA